MKEDDENRLDNLLSLPYAKCIQFVAVGHTHMHIKDKTDGQIYAMLIAAKKTARFFSRKYMQFFNGRKALKDMALPNNPLIISHLHTGLLNNASSTVHYHFAFGNLPSCINQEDIELVFHELWVKRAMQSDKKLWLKKANIDNTSWLHYGHGENRFRHLLGLDIFSTNIPHNAYATSICSAL
jgi:hypothetical protein